jgi:hypothetical protein
MGEEIEDEPEGDGEGDDDDDDDDDDGEKEVRAFCTADYLCLYHPFFAFVLSNSCMTSVVACLCVFLCAVCSERGDASGNRGGGSGHESRWGSPVCAVLECVCAPRVVLLAPLKEPSPLLRVCPFSVCAVFSGRSVSAPVCVILRSSCT